MSPLENRLGHKFRNPLLLAEALTHPSIARDFHGRHFDNQRLEFLGDAVLQVILTEHLFRTFPDLAEGDLTKMRSRLVSREALSIHATVLGLGDHLMLSRGEEMSGGRKRPSALADAFEAVVGAMFLDAGLEVTRKVVTSLVAAEVENLAHDPIHVNPKGRLQEILQGFAVGAPVYTVVEESGPEHNKQFVSTVAWQGVLLGRGSGQSKKQSENMAALDALANRSWEALLGR